ncbi:MAG: sulfotransferase, partial [Ghiorsea sp.]
MSAMPDMPNLTKLRAMEFVGEGKNIEAERLLAKLQDDSECAMQLAAMAFAAENFKQGLCLVERLETMDGLIARAAFNEALGNTDASIKLIEKAYKLNGGLIDQLVLKQLAAGKHSDVLRVTEGLDASTLSNAVLMAMGESYVSQSELDKAQSVLDVILDREPNNIFAVCLEESVHKNSAHLLPKAVLLEESLDLVSTPRIAMPNIHHVLGKIYEDSELYQKSFDHYVAGAKLDSESKQPYMPIGEVVENLKKIYTKEFLADKMHAVKDHNPLVFIVGMPRSGTTLTEQILISHPDIETRGETLNVGQHLNGLLSGSITAETPDEALADYLKMTGEVKSKFVIDKMPA